MIQHASEGAPRSDRGNPLLQALLDGLTPTHKAGSTGQAKDRETLEAYVRSSPHPAEALATCLNEARLRPPSDEGYVRGLIRQPAGCPITQQAYQSLVEQAQQAWDVVRLQPSGREAPGGLHKRAALDAALCAWGSRAQETQTQLKGIMRVLLAQNMVAEASVMAVELCCGHGQLDDTADAELIAGASRLFRPGLEAGPSRDRDVYLSVGRDVLHRFAHFLAPEAAATLREAAAQLSPTDVEDPSASSPTQEPVSPVLKAAEPPCNVAPDAPLSGPSAAVPPAIIVPPATVVAPPPPPLSPDERLTKQVTELLASVKGPHEDAIHARVEAQILELQEGGTESRGSARIWLRYFFALVTGYQPGRETLRADTAQTAFGLFDEKAPLPTGTANSADRLHQALADIHHAPVGVAAFKRWALDAAQQPGPHLVALYGPSGTGKTELIRRLGRGLFESAHVETFQLGSCQRAMDVTGTPLGIVAARPSPFAAALMARRGRPVVMTVDEVDKAPVEVQTVFAAMADFSQPFHDTYFDFPIYLHGLVVGCTYNDEDKLIPHLRDRLRPQAIEIGAPDPLQRKRYFERFLTAELASRQKRLEPLPADMVQAIDKNLKDVRSLRALQGHAKKLAQVVIDRNDDEVRTVVLTTLNVSETFATPQVSVLQVENFAELPRDLRYHDWHRLSYRAVVPKDAAEETLAVRWDTGNAVVNISVRQLSALSLPRSTCGHRGSCAVLVMLNQRLFCLRVRGDKTLALQGWPILDELKVPFHGFYKNPTVDSEPHFVPLDDGLNHTSLDVLVTDCLLV